MADYSELVRMADGLARKLDSILVDELANLSDEFSSAFEEEAASARGNPYTHENAVRSILLDVQEKIISASEGVAEARDYASELQKLEDEGFDTMNNMRR